MTTKRELPAESNYGWAVRNAKKLRIGRAIEAHAPILLGACAGMSFCWIEIDESQATALNDRVLPLAVSVAAILAGFQGAMHAIFLATSRTKAVQYLREVNAYKSLMRYISSGVLSLVLFVASAMLVITMYSIELLPDRPQLIYGILVGLFVFSLLASSRIMILLLRLLRHADDQAG